MLLAGWLAAGLGSCQSPPDIPMIPLRDAVTRGNVKQVEAVLYWCRRSGDCDPNEPDRDGQTPLHIAGRTGWQDVAKTLLDNGADVNVRDANEQTPLHVAVAAGKAGTAALLIDAGAEINTTDSLESSPLDEALISRRVDILRLLIDAGADVNGPGGPELSPLEKLIISEAVDSYLADSSESEKREGQDQGLRAVVEMMLAAGAKEDPENIAHLLDSTAPAEVRTKGKRGRTGTPAPTFHGRPCTTDCSGHAAGYEWAEKKGLEDPEDCTGKSRSFIEGCRTYVEQHGWRPSLSDGPMDDAFDSPP